MELRERYEEMQQPSNADETQDGDINDATEKLERKEKEMILAFSKVIFFFLNGRDIYFIVRSL